ncbi:MAG: hypothetical protein IT566_06980 [Rhodospirillaceae bacterium]|nr:hypothetical protein [Rhodospirillaceae bacterium]
MKHTTGTFSPIPIVQVALLAPPSPHPFSKSATLSASQNIRVHKRNACGSLYSTEKFRVKFIYNRAPPCERDNSRWNRGNHATGSKGNAATELGKKFPRLQIIFLDSAVVLLQSF